MSRHLRSQYDPASYDDNGRSYRRMSIDSPELYWNGKEWVRFGELEDITNNNNEIDSGFDWGKWLLWTALFLSIAAILFFAYMLLFV